MSYIHKINLYALLVLTLLLYVSTVFDSNDQTLNDEIEIEMAVSTVSKDDIVTRMNEFSFNVSDTVSTDTTGNVIFSPFSIYTALAMIGLGAHEKTKKEITNALRWKDDSMLPLLDTLKPLYNSISQKQNGTTLDIANKAWVGDNVVLLDTYQERLNNYFQVEIGKENFSKDAESARGNINNWVAQQTDQHIKELFPSGSIVDITELVLANAVYFKGEWANKFDVLDTHQDVFHVTKETQVKVDFMFMHDKFSTAVDIEHGVQLLELPYASGIFSMIFAIPLKNYGNHGKISYTDLKQVEMNITDKAKVLKDWINKLPNITEVKSDVDIFVPKFEIKLGIDLIATLNKLGIHDLFVPGTANLSGINGNTNLYVSSALHKSYLKVDEEGTTAAAATGFAANTFSMPEEVQLNHPFLFYIIHKSSNAIIFSGKVQNPLE